MPSYGVCARTANGWRAFSRELDDDRRFPYRRILAHGRVDVMLRLMGSS